MIDQIYCKFVENTHLGRPVCRGKDYIRKDLKEIDISMSNWVDLAQDRDYW
jgi:hypothetical protein